MVNNKIFFLIPVLFSQAPTALVGQISLIDSLSHERPANVGESYSGRLILVNSESDEVEVRVSQSDHLYFQDARNDQKQPGKLERSNAGWISFAKASLVIPPFSTVEVEYTVSVPVDRKIFGTYWSTPAAWNQATPVLHSGASPETKSQRRFAWVQESTGFCSAGGSVAQAGPRDGWDPRRNKLTIFTRSEI